MVIRPKFRMVGFYFAKLRVSVSSLRLIVCCFGYGPRGFVSKMCLAFDFGLLIFHRFQNCLGFPCHLVWILKVYAGNDTHKTE